MNELIQIKFVNAGNNTEESRESINNFFSTIVEKAIELNIWDTAIKKIVITDDFNNEIHKQAEIWNIKTLISQEKEYRVASKILFNDNLEIPEYYIFFDYQYFYSENHMLIETVFRQILNVYSKKIIPNEIKEYKFNYRPSSLVDYVKFASSEWCRTVYTRNYLNEILAEQTPLMNQNDFLVAFKRKLKKNLFEYYSDKPLVPSRIDLFWSNYFDSLYILFERIIENDTDKKGFLIKETEPSRNLIYAVINEIEELTKKCLAQEVYDVTNLKEAIKKISEHFEIFLEDETEKNFSIRLTKDPKDYFIDEIVETEPRIICFMDILGFSELINKYDGDVTSTILQDIQESFASAKTDLLENKTQQYNDAVRHLKYQTFSDNICISIPYFDNENDFIANFNLLINFVRRIQSILMTKGFFTRGGVSMGSYYSDNNIIFSKGLVNAYHLESKKAIYPRVIIDNLIIEKLFKYNPDTVKYFEIDRAIILDWENTPFLNPFGLLQSSVQQFKSQFNELNSEDHDPLTEKLNSFKKDFDEMLDNSFKSVVEDEKESLQLIKDKIAKNIQLNAKNENIVSKYLWLFEFVKWFEKDESAKLKFQFMTELMN